MRNRIIATGDNMLSLFVGVDIRQPFRCQPHVEILVPFTEYIKYLKVMLNFNVQWFRGLKPDLYKEALHDSKSNLLEKCYMHDISVAVMNEVCFAAMHKENATNIRHIFMEDTDVNILCESDISTRKVTPVEKREASRTFTNVNYYDVVNNPDALTLHNLSCVKYAYVLRDAAYSRDYTKFNVEWRLNMYAK